MCVYRRNHTTSLHSISMQGGIYIDIYRYTMQGGCVITAIYTLRDYGDIHTRTVVCISL